MELPVGEAVVREGPAKSCSWLWAKLQREKSC